MFSIESQRDHIIGNNLSFPQCSMFCTCFNLVYKGKRLLAFVNAAPCATRCVQAPRLLSQLCIWMLSCMSSVYTSEIGKTHCHTVLWLYRMEFIYSQTAVSSAIPVPLWDTCGGAWSSVPKCRVTFTTSIWWNKTKFKKWKPHNNREKRGELWPFWLWIVLSVWILEEHYCWKKELDCSHLCLKHRKYWFLNGREPGDQTI